LVSQHSINYKNKNMKGKAISYITRRNLFKLGGTAVGTGFVTSQLGIVGAILEQIRPAVASTSPQSPDRFRDATIANVKNQIAILKNSSVIADLIKSNKLKIVGGFYDLDTGLMAQVA
jgi:carbonic anhydrase